MGQADTVERELSQAQMIAKLGRHRAKLERARAALDAAEAERSALYAEARSLSKPLTFRQIADAYGVTVAAVMQKAARTKQSA